MNKTTIASILLAALLGGVSFQAYSQQISDNMNTMLQQAIDNGTPIDQATAELAAAYPAQAANILTAVLAITASTPDALEGLVSAIISAAPDYAAEIIQTAIEALPDSALIITQAAVNAGASTDIIIASAIAGGADASTVSDATAAGFQGVNNALIVNIPEPQPPTPDPPFIIEPGPRPFPVPVPGAPVPPVPPRVSND